jgi:hypothetical protein
MKQFLLATAVTFSLIGSSLGATCVGATPCNACKNCHYCGFCAKRGGKCGVCAGHHARKDFTRHRTNARALAQG